MISSLTTRIIDNLQLQIKNVHLRIEQKDAVKIDMSGKKVSDPANNFSRGLSLESVDVYTVSDKGQRIFIDRTKPDDKLEPLHKRLIIENFGIYYKTAEDHFVSDAGETRDQRK